MSLFLGLGGMVCFILGGRLLFSLGVILYLLSLILDFVDGNIARVTDTATYYGKFLDGAVNAVIEIMLPFSVAVGFYFKGYGDLPLFIGVGSAMVLAFAAFLLNRLSFFSRLIEMDVREGKIEPPELSRRAGNLNPLKSSRFPLEKVGQVLWDLKILALLVSGVVGMIDLLFIVLMASIGVRALVYSSVVFMDASSQLDVHKISKWDSRSQRNIK